MGRSAHSRPAHTAFRRLVASWAHRTSPMKNATPLLYLAAVAALIALPASVDFTIPALLIAGLVLVLAQDCSPRRPLRLPVRRAPRKLQARFFPPALNS